MRCDTFNMTMHSKHCLLYQERARGTAPLKDVQVNGGPRGILVIWAQKYLPCLTCKTGKEVRNNKGKDMDDDVKALKEKQLDKINEVTGEIRKCKICNNLMSNGYFTRSPVICDDCVAKSLMEVVPKTVSDRLDQIIELARENNTPDRTCTRCGSTGPEKGFHKAGASGYINVCRKCIRKRQEDNRKSRGLLATDIVIKFADYPQALEQIKREADRNFRTVEHEILFRLVRMGAIND